MINKCKQYLRLITSEVNVKEVSFVVGNTEKGKLCITYFHDDDHLSYTMDGQLVYSKKLEETIAPALLQMLRSTDAKKRS